MSQTVARLYDSYEDAEATIRDLEAVGVSHDDISVVANNVEQQHTGTARHAHNQSGIGAELGAGVGAVAGGGAGLLAGLGMLAIPGVGPVVAAGWLVALVAGAAGGAAAGGLLGGLVGAGISKDEAEIFAEGIRRGGTLVSVRASDAMVGRIAGVMDAHRSVDIAGRRVAYSEAGWTGYDPAARAYTRAEIERERSSLR